jgi:hypothetical protein
MEDGEMSDRPPPPEMKTYTYSETPGASWRSRFARLYVASAVLLGFVIYASLSHIRCERLGGVLAVSLGVPPLVCVAPLQEVKP